MVDKLFNSQDSLGLIDTSELFKDTIEENIFEVMNHSISPDSQGFYRVDILENVNESNCINETAEQMMLTAPPTGTIPSQEDFTGPYGFELHWPCIPYSRGSFVYSPVLKQVFIGMNNILMMEFKTTVDTDSGFYIRALMMYTCNDYICVPVIRCASHALEDDPQQGAHARGREQICKCADYNNVGHVMRCSLADAEYCYDSYSERHSVRVPVRRLQAGTDFIQVPYSFSCKNSCPRGMQRKPVQIIFTLETEEGLVLGRKVLPIKICSCPKRDKERQERDFKKAQLSQSCPSSSKRISSATLGDILQPPVKSIKTEDNVEDTQNEEENQRHRRQIPIVHSSNTDQDINQILRTKLNSIEEALYRIEEAQKKDRERLDRFINEVMQYRP